ncbi:MAG TPA: hypothetical protein VGU01_08220 [Sphingomicrobium sp.]|nr:hypothetical protein [Sphingomicrobium sp.]
MTSLSIKFGLAAAAFVCVICPGRLRAADPPALDAITAHEEQRQYAKFLPPLETVALPSEQAVLAAFLEKMRAPDRTPAVTVAAADEALAKLPSPTSLRGMIQYARAQALENLGRDLEAVEATEESVQLLQGYSAPLIKAFTLNAYLNRTAPATDYLMRAIRVDPNTARTIDDYEINNLLRRLQGFHDEARARAISDRLLQIGWIGNHVGSRSQLAVEAIKLHVANGDIAGARALVPKLLQPTDSRELLIMNAYAQIWPDIESWAGPRLERQWPIYLAEARERWEAGKSTIAARDYLSALFAVGHYEAAVREFLPMFDAPALNDDELIFMVPPLANSLAHLGRWSDADALYERAEQTWPLGWRANALNVSANHALLLLEEGHTEKALKLMDSSLADARRWGPQVGQTALARMEHSRACMLHALGRDVDARVSMTEALAVERGPAAATLHLCMGSADLAKTTLLHALADEATREDVVRFMQRPGEAPDPSPYDQKQRAAADALRADPELVQAVALYGRILPWQLNDASGKTQHST